jgi:membrane fusion protein, multidrug efflux system
MGAHAGVSRLNTGLVPPRMRGRRLRPYLFTGLGLLLLVVLLAGIKGSQIASMVSFGKRAAKAGPPPESVATFVAQQQTWDETLPSVGSVAAARGVSISNEVPGVVSRITFESGETVREHQVLVELDTSVERAQLASVRARQSLAAANLKRTQALVTSGALSQSQLDTDSAQLAGAAADSDALAAQIERKTVRAPFAGKLGIRLVNVGQYLPAGTSITVLESSDATYVDFDLPQQDLPEVRVGMPVRFTLESGDAGRALPPAEGALFAIDPAVDPATRSIKLRASVPADADWLRPGMFVDVAVVKPETAGVVAVPGTSVVHAPYGDSVFLVEDAPADTGAAPAAGKPRKVARQQFVRLGGERGDFVAVVDGVQAGQAVVSAGAFKLRNGVPVTVDDEVQAKPELNPHPPNR